MNPDCVPIGKKLFVNATMVCGVSEAISSQSLLKNPSDPFIVLFLLILVVSAKSYYAILYWYDY